MMPNPYFSVEVLQRYLKKITGAKSLQALAEWYWKAIDADAVRFQSALGTTIWTPCLR